MVEQKIPGDGRQAPQDVNDAELDQVAGGARPLGGKPLNPQPLPPISP